MGAALVFNAWHLPSDVGGGFCVATAWAAAAAQLVRRPLDRGVPGRLVGVAVVLVALAALAALDLRPGLSFTLTSHGRLLEAAVGIAITAAACCAAFAYASADRKRVDDALLILAREPRVERQRHRPRAAVLADRQHPFAEAVPLAHVRLQVDRRQVRRRRDPLVGERAPSRRRGRRPPGSLTT